MPKLTKRQLKEEFNKFLRENDCASKFYANFYHPKAKRWRKKYSIKYTPLREAINYAFDWDDSSESNYYWGIKNTTWKRKYKELTA